MGIKTIISLEDIKPYIDARELIPTKDGAVNSVYIIDDSFVLKLFEDAKEEDVILELELLGLCSRLQVPNVVSEVIVIQNRPALIYEKCKGQSLKKANIPHISQVGSFLKSFQEIKRVKK